MRALSTLSATFVICCLALVAFSASAVAAQPGKVPAPAAPPRAAAKLAAVPTAGPYRALVPGTEITIAPDRQEEETFSRHDIIELVRGVPGLNWKPQFTPDTQTLNDMSTKTVFRRDVWCLELTFKPVRMLWVDVPQDNGLMQRKLIWYMVYHVRNTAGNLTPAKNKDGTYAVKTAPRDVRFFPQFVLESHEYNKSYVDRIVPVAIAAIQAKEDPNRRLLNSVEISAKPIPQSTDSVDKSVWGVATWEGIDPRVDYFSVYVEGLSNAYRWSDDPAAFKPGDPPGTGRAFVQKTLMLNFWRPGDEYVEDKRVIRYGIPGQVDYRWVYR